MKTPVITTVGANVQNTGINVLIYGAAGVGKTVTCSTAPSPIILSAESGLLSIKHRPDIPVIVVNEIQDVHDAYHWLAANGRKYKLETVCLDSLSEIAEKCLVAVKKRSKDPRAAYGETADEIIDLVKKFRDLPDLNCVITAKHTIEKDAITGVEKAVPGAPGKQIGPALPYLFDFVFHAATDKDAERKTYHYLQTKASFNVDAKDRSGILEEREYPDLTYLFNKVRNPSQGA